MTREEAIRTYVEQLNESDLVSLIQYMNSCDGSFEEVTYYPMESFDEVMSNGTPSEIARMIWYGKFNPNDEYFRFDAYGNLESFDWYDVVAEAEDLKDDIIDHLASSYRSNTPWADLTYLVDADDDAIFNEDYEEVDEEEEH